MPRIERLKSPIKFWTNFTALDHLKMITVVQELIVSRPVSIGKFQRIFTNYCMFDISLTLEWSNLANYMEVFHLCKPQFEEATVLTALKDSKKRSRTDQLIYLSDALRLWISFNTSEL